MQVYISAELHPLFQSRQIPGSEEILDDFLEIGGNEGSAGGKEESLGFGVEVGGEDEAGEGRRQVCVEDGTVERVEAVERTEWKSRGEEGLCM